MIRAFARSVVDAMLDRVFTWALWHGVRDRDARVVVSYRSAQIARELEGEEMTFGAWPAITPARTTLKGGPRKIVGLKQRPS